VAALAGVREATGWGTGSASALKCGLVAGRDRHQSIEKKQKGIGGGESEKELALRDTLLPRVKKD